MPSDPASTLSKLLQSSTIIDHEEVLKAANAAIKANKGDLNSHHTRVVAYLNLDRFDDALRAIDEGGSKLDQECAKEKAYALYKLRQLDDAKAVCRGAGLKDRSFRHIAAQVAYRGERFEEAQELYQRLMSEEAGAEVNDVTINAKASAAQRQWQGTSQPTIEDKQLDTFELCYNVACSHIGTGDFEKASTLLQRAARLCDGSDDLEEEDKQAEMQPILAQQAYAYARLGKLKEAMDLYKSLNQSGTNDPDLNLVIQNNQSALDVEPQNPYFLQRKMATWSSDKDAKLFNYQSDLLRRNVLVVDLQANKTPGIVRRTEKAIKDGKHPSTSSRLGTMSVLNAAAQAHHETGKALIRAVKKLLVKRPHDVGLALTVVQLHIQQGSKGAAFATLESFLARLEQPQDADTKDAEETDEGDDAEDPVARRNDVRFSPGLVALNVSLMRSQGSETSVKIELKKAAKYWQSRPAGGASSLLLEAGIELLRSPNLEDLQLAGSAFEKLFAEQHGSHIAAAGLVASLATSDPKKAEQYVGALPEAATLIKDVNLEALIGAGVAVPGNTYNAPKRSAPKEDEADKRLAKKRRIGKLPKDYDENKKPDPERWLPLRDRSSYRPKGKKGKKKAADSTQGGVVKEEEMLDLVGGGGVKVEKALASGGNKKKKKGKK